MTTFSMKLQSPDYNAAGVGYEIALPVNQDSYNGDSMASILALFDGNNKVMDFRQLREVITLVGVITTQSALIAGFTKPDGTGNVIQMRDEMRRVRASLGDYGHNTGAAKSWLQEGNSGGSWTSSALIAAGEDDAGTSRSPATCRLIWDKYWKNSISDYSNLYLYGTVNGINFGPRMGASTQTRIPFSLTFLVGSIQVG